MTVRIFGIRHHGVGSARSLRKALVEFQPDAVLIEGPPDADKVIPLAANAGMQPPVALLVYNPAEPKRAAWYPFAVYSPEWQAIQFALAGGAHAQFMDLPQKHMLAMQPEIPDGDPMQSSAPPLTMTPDMLIRLDPLRALAEAAGYADSERWWEHVVEERRDSTAIFEAIQEVMAALRSEAGDHPFEPEREARREAWMRKTIRAAEKRFERVAVVCGAWHGPALADGGDAKADNDLLDDLPAMPTTATWAPWTYGRLSRDSGYGAGIESPGWYHHLWETPPDQVAVRWMSRVAGLLRSQDLSASTAQVIDAVRLAESLAALRDRPLPGLAEMNEASLAVFCQGDNAPLKLIWSKLIVSDTIGEVPSDVPTVPLQRDLEAQQKALRLKPSPEWKLHDLDLRKPNDLARSHLLHRLSLLGIPWGKREKQQVRATGTFHEYWRLEWLPEMAVAVIEAAVWGNTVLDAASAKVRHDAFEAEQLPALTVLLEDVLLADLPDAAQTVMQALQNAAALTTDTALLMDALPALVDVLRYGNVRQTDAGMVAHVVDGLVTRICVGLLPACVALDDDAAAAVFGRIVNVNAAVGLLQNETYTAQWQQTLQQIAARAAIHGLVVGRAVRILRDAGTMAREQVLTHIRLALSPASDPPKVAAWIEGFLKGSGAVLLFDGDLWDTLDAWLSSIGTDAFDLLLPLLRRTFATFQAGERREMAERVRRGRRVVQAAEMSINYERAEKVLPILSRILGVES
jgi:hypothetical protein